MIISELPIRVYIEDISNSSPAGSIDFVKGLHLGEFSWILPIEWSRYRQVQRECLTQSLSELNKILGYDVYTIVCGYYSKKVNVNKRADLLAKRYPIKNFLIDNQSIIGTDTTSWREFLTDGLFFEKETDTYYIQWWQVSLKTNFTENHILGLSNTSRRDTRIFGIALSKQNRLASDVLADNILSPIFLNNEWGGTEFSRDIYDFIVKNKILHLGIDDIEDGNYINYPCTSVYVRGDSDLIKNLTDKNTVLV
jgi:hypothetical protein